MASEFYVGVKIGASVLASFGTALAGSKNTLLGLGRVSEELKTKQMRIGEAVSKAMAHPTRNVGLLVRQYHALGRAMDEVKQKQIRLSAHLAKSETLRMGRSEMKSEMVGTAATALAVAAPVVGSVKQAANFETGLRDIAITGNLNKQEELRLGASIRQAALSTSQGHDAIMQGVNTLVAAGMDAKKAGTYAPLLGKVATATNADMKELAGMVFSFSETLGIKDDAGLKEAFNRAAHGAKLGRFELKDMAKAIPEMSAAFAAKGIRGQDALTQIIASLEVGREGAGSGDEAVTNLRNWLSHMNTKHTKDAYTKAGVDYQTSMQNLVAGGYSSYEASLEIARKFIAGRGDGFMKKWKEAGSKGDENAQRKLMESFGLNEVFQDIQTINHLLSMRQNWDKYQSTKKSMAGPEAKKTIDVDYQRRAELASKAWDNFKTRVNDVGITIGNALLPPLTQALTKLTPIIEKIGAFAAAHPGAIRAIVGFVGAVIGMKVATLALGWGLNFFVKSPLNMLGTMLSSVSGKYSLFRALLMGGSSRLSTVFQLFGMGAQSAGKLASGMGMIGRVAMTVGRFLSGTLVSGIQLVGKSVMMLGRALMLNPIGLIITAIGLGAYLIYRNWDKIKPFFTQLWSNVTRIFANAWAWIKKIFFSYTPLGLIIDNWQPLLNWFKELPGRFAEFGGNLIGGLVDGISNKINSAKEAIVGFASNIKNWFKETLGIHSPSRVFMGFGDNIAEGAAIGIGRSAKLANQAAKDMALDVSNTSVEALPNSPFNTALTSGKSFSGARAASIAAPAPISIQFSPSITITSSDTKTSKDQVHQALSLSLRELEQLIRKISNEQLRRAY